MKAILFDFGDTLVDFSHVDLDAAFDRGARDTYDLLTRQLSQTMPAFTTYRRYQLRALRWAYFKARITGREFNSIDVLRKCSHKLEINVPENSYAELAWRWYKPLADAATVEAGVCDTLADLRRRNLKLAIISNTFVPAQSLDRHLEQKRLIEYFPVRVYSCEVGIGKPKKAIFATALDRLTVRPGHAIFVGDSFRCDVRGARRAGMFAVLKSPVPVRKRFDDKTFQIKKISELPAIIDQIEEEFPDTATYSPTT